MWLTIKSLNNPSQHPQKQYRPNPQSRPSYQTRFTEASIVSTLSPTPQSEKTRFPIDSRFANTNENPSFSSVCGVRRDQIGASSFIIDGKKGKYFFYMN